MFAAFFFLTFGKIKLIHLRGDRQIEDISTYELKQSK